MCHSRATLTMPDGSEQVFEGETEFSCLSCVTAERHAILHANPEDGGLYVKDIAKTGAWVRAEPENQPVKVVSHFPYKWQWELIK